MAKKKKRKYTKRTKSGQKKNGSNNLALAIQGYVDAALDIKLDEAVKELKRLTARVGRLALNNKDAIQDLQNEK